MYQPTVWPRDCQRQPFLLLLRTPAKSRQLTQNWQENTTNERDIYVSIAQNRGVLEAVKAYQQDHQCGLKEAKYKIGYWISPYGGGNQSQEFRPYEEYEQKMKQLRKALGDAVFSISIFLAMSFLIIFCIVRNSRTDNELEWKAEPKNYVEKAFGINMKMVYVASGDFLMGCSDTDANCRPNQKPARLISLDTYYIGMTEVTQLQWQKVMGTDIGRQWELSGDSIALKGVGNNYPMHYVSWKDANEFCRRLSQKSKHIYQLPTEAQWEYAARGGINNDQTRYSGSNFLDTVCWHKGNSGQVLHPVGTRKCNSLAICDMSGSLWEHCLDWYTETYNPADTIEPRGPATGTERVLRGGSYWSQPGACDVRFRDHALPDDRALHFGFRVVMIP